MNFRKIFSREPENPNKDLEEISKIKQEIENEDKIFGKELPSKYNLLQEFRISDLRNLCMEVLGREPPVEYYDDSKLGRKELPRLKEDYVHFIVDELRLSEIRNYALKKQVVSEGIVKKYKLE
jgi:hypothetical protein